MVPGTVAVLDAPAPAGGTNEKSSSGMATNEKSSSERGSTRAAEASVTKLSGAVFVREVAVSPVVLGAARLRAGAGGDCKLRGTLSMGSRFWMVAAAGAALRSSNLRALMRTRVSNEPTALL